jgi:hypothetical protein
MTRTRAFTLPHGALADGRVDREVEVRIPTGEDELDLLERARTPAERISTMLERCMIRLGAREPTQEDVRLLVPGDREAVLLQIRAAAFGKRLDCVLDCPACDAAMDVEFSIDDLLVEPYADPSRVHEEVVGDGKRVRFRLPTGLDVEEIARSTSDPERAAIELLERCIVEAGDARQLPAQVADQLTRRMAELDPQAEIAFVMRCPECGADVRASLDAARALFDELARSEDELYAEIHSLALHYHWSERDILALEVPSRRRYLTLLADSAGAAA